MWIATIDFTKAFDSITHKSIGKALKTCGINHEYISLLKKIYKDQKSSVQTDVESNMFEIKKGTKQGDPLSSLLFSTVLQNSLKEVTQRWQKKKGMGIYLSDRDHDCLTNLRFADDVLLFATSKDQLQKMLYESKESTEKVGLRIHPEKTKVLSNQSSLCSEKKKKCKSTILKLKSWQEVKAWDTEDSWLHSSNRKRPKIKNRIRAAWATFHKKKQELTSKNYLLKHRLRLFDAAITPTMCCASGTWEPTKEHERKIQSAQRKMLRLIIQKKQIQKYRETQS